VRRVRADRSGLTAAAILGGAGAGGALAGTAADGWFLAAVGPAHLGAAVAGSSLLVAVVLAAVGALADRRDRRRTLVALAASGAVLLAIVSVGHGAAPRTSAIVAFIATKQLQAAVELAFWVAVSEWFDARAIRRMVPRLAAAGGLGAGLGAGLAIPLARFGGASAVMLAGGFAFALVGLAAGTAPTTRRLGAGLGRAPVGRWRDGLVAMRHHPLAIGLAIVVAIAGVFASLAYVSLGAAAAARHTDASALAGFLASVRLVSQLLMIVAQVVIAPRLIAWLGVGGVLVVPPVAALCGALGLAGAGGLTAAATMQIQARVTDGAIEGPAEKLALNLLPAELRGRLGGWLEGPAKRTGAIAGGLIASVAIAAPGALAWVAVAAALAWLAAAWWVRARLPGWALDALVEPRDPRDSGDVPLGERAARQLIARVAAVDAVRAVEVAARLHRPGGFDARPGLAARTHAARGPLRHALVDALARLHCPGDLSRELAFTLAHAPRTDDADDDAALVGLAGRLGRGSPLALADDERAPVAAAIAIATARIDDDRAGFDRAVDDALEGDAGLRALGAQTLADEVADRAVRGDADAIAAGRALLRVARRGAKLPVAIRAAAITALADLIAQPRADAEALLLRSGVHELVHSLASALPQPPAPVVAAALAALARWPAAIAADELALLADALGDRDDAIRSAAEDGLRALGPQTIVALVRAAGLGRRAARDRAVALLGELAVSADAVEALVLAELDALDRVAVHAATLAQLGDRWLDRRQDERLAEIGHTALLLVAAQTGARPIARAARQLRAAQSLDERARAVELLDAALPRAVAIRLVPLLEPGALATRSHRARGRVGRTATLDETITAELTGPDPLTRDLLVRALPSARRTQFRGALAAAARAVVDEISPLDLLRRVTTDDDDDDVPPAVDVMLVLAELPALAALSTPQLAALTARGETRVYPAGAALCAEGERLDCLIVVLDGTLRCGDRTVTRGQAVDELAALAPRAVAQVVATAPARVFRLRRLALDELIDDEPGLGAALLRYLAERVRERG